jgi:hypothetical protein
MSYVIIHLSGTACQVFDQLDKIVAEHGPRTTLGELKVKYEGGNV